MTEKAPTRPRRRRPSGKLKSERIQEALPRIEITVKEIADATVASAPEVKRLKIELSYPPEEP